MNENETALCKFINIEPRPWLINEMKKRRVWMKITLSLSFDHHHETQLKTWIPSVFFNIGFFSVCNKIPIMKQTFTEKCNVNQTLLIFLFYRYSLIDFQNSKVHRPFISSFLSLRYINSLKYLKIFTTKTTMIIQNKKNFKIVISWPTYLYFYLKKQL